MWFTVVSFYVPVYVVPKDLVNNLMDRFTVFNEVLNWFRNLADPILEKIISNKLSIQKVKALLDTLLPKLMSGEIRIDTNE